MRHTALTALATLLLFATPTLAQNAGAITPAAPKVPDDYQAPEPMSLALLNSQIDATNVVVGDEMGGFCSGTIIDIERRLVMTAAHCTELAWRTVEKEFVDPVTGEVTTKKIREKKELEVWHNTYKNFAVVAATHYVVKIVAESYTDDVAVLQIKDESFRAPAEVKLAIDDRLTRGQHIWLVSNPYIMLDNSLTEGRITGELRSFKFESKLEEFFQHSAVAVGGSSGGVVLNDQGEIVGTHVRGNGAGIGLGVPVAKLKKLLKSVSMGDVFETPKVTVSSGKMDDK